MACFRCLLATVALLLIGAARLSAAAPDEQHAFDAALEKRKLGFFDLAEKGFKEFTDTYTNSPRLPEAILYQAEAQISQNNYAAAIQLLSSRQNIAGTNWADHYLFWLSEAQFRKGDFQPAADGFAKLTKDFPRSTRLLEAVLREATVRAQLRDWPRVLALLQQTNGIFQSAAATNAADTNVVQGYLLFSEAALAQKDYEAADRALDALSKRSLGPGPSWQWNYLRGRIRLSQGRVEEALPSATNMLSKAAEAAQPGLRADSFAFLAGLFERLGRINEALAIYTNNLATNAPPEPQRQALLKMTELALTRNSVPEAIPLLQTFLNQYPTGPAADLAWLTLGELQLRLYATLTETNTPNSASNALSFLQQAQSSLETLAAKFPQSPLFGKAQLDLGWVLWFQKKMPDCENAFQLAVARLPASPDQATAYFKLADAQFQQKKLTNAIANYNAVIEKFSASNEVKTNLFEPVLYQLTRAALDAGDRNTATNAVAKLMAWYPKGFHTVRGVLFAGQQLSQQGNPAEARKMFTDLLALVPDAPLTPQVRLAIARTLEDEEKWVDVVGQYDSWLASYTNHDARPVALYFQARANFLANRQTNALALFTDFVAKFPTNELAPLAQWWVADYYYGKGDWQSAESNFQLLFQKWPTSELTYRARLMAGRCAFARKSWASAINFFTNITSDLRCPKDLWLEAVSAYGDTLISKDSTNKVADYDEAIRVFNVICQYPPTNHQIVLAWGQLANCHMQRALASRQQDALANALNGFQVVITNYPRADATARSIATVGVGVVLEAQAESRPAAEQLPLLKLALENYLNVFTRLHLHENEKPDDFWTKEAGLNAGRLAEKLQMWVQAINVYQSLKEQLPQMSIQFDNRIRKAQEHLPTALNSR